MTNRSIHWVAPTVMLGGLIAGILFAMGHHLYYSHLAGRPVSTSAYSLLGTRTSRQEFNVAVGTAFAFLVKTSLVFAISVAFLQIFWKAVRSRSGAKAATFSQLDTLFGALNDVFALGDFKVWFRFPLLMAIAAIAWLLPIAAVITPSTLSIATVPVQHTLLSREATPNIDFRSLNFVAGMPVVPERLGLLEGATEYTYAGPSQDVSIVATAVMAQGAIMPIKPPAINSSWALQFSGPALSCDNVDSRTQLQLERNIRTKFEQSEDVYAFMSWFPSVSPLLVTNASVNSLPFQSASTNSSLSFSTNSLSATVYIYALQRFWDYVGNAPSIAQPGIPKHPKLEVFDGSMIKCNLVNATYNVSFNYTDGEQRVSVDTTITDTDSKIIQAISVGEKTKGFSYTCNTLVPLGTPDDACFIDIKALEQLSYGAVMDAFSKNIVGSIYNTEIDGLHRDSNVINTALLNTNDLSFLSNNGSQTSTLQDTISTFHAPEFQGFTTHAQSSRKLPLQSAIEQMFRNVTVSLMSSAALQPNYTSLTAPSPPNVTVHTFHNVYAYSRWKLWLAYGIAIAVTLIVIVLGMVAMVQNGASYSDNFSTVYRVAKGSHAGEVIREEDLDGRDPLPEYLGGAEVFFNSKDGGGMDDGTKARISTNNDSTTT